MRTASIPRSALLASLFAAPVFARVENPVMWTEKERTKLIQEYAEFTKAAADARAFLANEEKYPPPHGVFEPGRDAQKGQDEMEQLVSAAVIAHNRFVKDACAVLKLATDSVGRSRPYRQPKPAKPQKPSGKDGAGESRGTMVQDVEYEVVLPRTADLEKLVTKCAKTPGAASPSTAKADGSGVVPIFSLIASAKYSEAVGAAEKIEGLDAAITRMAFDAMARKYNDDHPEGHDANEMKGVRVINAYRDALDIRPLLVDAKLHEMAKQFAQDQSKLGFFSHEHPSDPSKRTTEDRAKRIGYEGAGLGENLANFSDGPEVAWGWRVDAGHHSVLVTTDMRALGLGCAGNAVLDVGSVSYAPIAPLLGKPVDRPSH